MFFSLMNLEGIPLSLDMNMKYYKTVQYTGVEQSNYFHSRLSGITKPN